MEVASTTPEPQNIETELQHDFGNDMGEATTRVSDEQSADR